jgi:peptidoglycan-associated lipoprotein
MKFLILLFLIATSFPALSVAQELTVGYTYVRANAPPGECDCFNMNGGSVSLEEPFKDPHYAFVADATVVQASKISAGGYDLTLGIYSLGFRYRPLPYSPWSPFGQLLLGASHASGSLVQGDTPAAGQGSLVFAGTVGGGMDYWFNERWSVRVFEADYLLDRYHNRTDDRQDNLRISVGVTFHFDARH